VVTSGFETQLKTKVVAKFLTHCGRSDIPICRGINTREAPYLLPDSSGLLQQQETYVEGCVINPILRRWAQGYDMKTYEGPIFDDVCGHGLDPYLINVINSTPSLTYVLQGSSENVGYLLDKDALIFRRNNVRIVCMGGTFEQEHEYNFCLDPVNTRRMLACANSVTVIPVEPCFCAKLECVKQVDKAQYLDPKHSTYDIYLNGDSAISLAMAQIQLALANYGTHIEVANGTTDIMFDLVAAFVATERKTELYKLEEITATISDQGKIMPTTEEIGGSVTFSVMVGWVSAEALAEFKYHVAKSIAMGVNVHE
jgi:inosine-uridine nucleoside N-ribohydrolase